MRRATAWSDELPLTDKGADGEAIGL